MKEICILFTLLMSSSLYGADMDKKINVLTYNIWNWNRNEEIGDRMLAFKEAMQSIEAQIICLQEVRDNGFFEKDYNPKKFAEEQGCKYIFHPGMKNARGSFGQALLTKFPILWHDYIDLHIMPGDFRVAQLALLDTPIRKVLVVNAHLEWESAETNMKQINLIQKALGILLAKYDLSERPIVIFAGDFNMTPDVKNIQQLLGNIKTEPRLPFEFVSTLHLCNPKKELYTYDQLKNKSIKGDIRKCIDYLMIDKFSLEQKTVSVENSEIVLDKPFYKGLYASDHFAILTTIKGK